MMGEEGQVESRSIEHYAKIYYDPEYRLKCWARNKISHLVRTGKLKRPAVCPKCNNNKQMIEAHHDDYSSPLKIKWLCITCHRKLHRELRKKSTKK
jgi:hypothetical protein